MKKFSNHNEYESWTESFENCSDYEQTPVVIDDGHKISADMFTACKSYKVAIRRFGKAFESIPEIQDWIETIRESCESGYFEDHSEYHKNGCYGFGVEETMEGYWYIYLNISGVYANR